MGLLAKLKPFFALSRTPHGLVDLATPVLGALLVLGEFPPLSVLFLGLVTAFSGYTAVYALNDVIDYPIDKLKLQRGGFDASINYLDAVMIRHPLAHGVVSFKAAILWVAFWSTVTLIGAYALNPVCSFIFIIGCALEILYCRMWRTSHLRAIVSGMVKTCGGVAAVYAVQPDPDIVFVIVLFLWIFFWEIGGQNIPADWTDIKEDHMLGAKTIPVELGPAFASSVVFGCLVMAVLLNVGLLQLAHGEFGVYVVGIALIIGIYFLLVPSWHLCKSRGRADAMVLFNRASHYPLALLILIIVTLVYDISMGGSRL